MRTIQVIAKRTPSIYLAGKISKNDWRQGIVGDLRSAGNLSSWSHDGPDLRETWPVEEKAIFGVFDYTGPFFVSCDHGCYHAGAASHGVGADGNGCAGLAGMPPTEWGSEDGIVDNRAKFYSAVRPKVLQRCREAIQRSDIVFAWLDCLDAYGTFAEIGYAHALGKRVWIAMPEPLNDLWFVQQMAEDVCVGIKKPEHALASLLLTNNVAGQVLLYGERTAKGIR